MYASVVDSIEERCGCGHDRAHPMVRPEKSYSFWGQIAFGLFYTPLPVAIRFRCGKCRAVVGAIDEPELMQKFRYREPKPEER